VSATDRQSLRRMVHQRVLARSPIGVDRHALRPQVADALDAAAPALGRATRTEIIDACLDDLVGFGLLEPYLHDDTVTEVLYNGRGRLFVERRGDLEPVPCGGDDDDIVRVVQRILAPLGLRLDRSSPMVDARLPDGARLHAVIPPLALDGPVVSIRRFPRARFGLDAFGLGPDGLDRLQLAVRQHRTILVAGGTGSGKTTLVAALASEIGAAERIVTIEETAELAIEHPHVVRLEARPPNAEGVGAVDVRSLVRAALRMRPDRIIIGEVRGGEAFDMLQACNTGHAGSLGTVHANGPTEALRRLEHLALMGGPPLPFEAVRDQVRGAIDLVVFTERGSSGQRCVQSVLDVTDLCARNAHD